MTHTLPKTTMSDNPAAHEEQGGLGPRIYVDLELVPQIEAFQRIHRGNFKAACNALILKGLNAERAEKPHTTPGQPPAQAQS